MKNEVENLVKLLKIQVLPWSLWEAEVQGSKMSFERRRKGIKMSAIPLVVK